jgi:hypothetical protein
MTKQEFEERVEMSVSDNEFDAINIVYMSSDVDKDEFCRLWCKMNYRRIKEALWAAREEKKRQSIRVKINGIYEQFICCNFETNYKQAVYCFTVRQIFLLEKVNIYLGNKKVYEVVDEISNFLGK